MMQLTASPMLSTLSRTVSVQLLVCSDISPRDLGVLAYKGQMATRREWVDKSKEKAYAQIVNLYLGEALTARACARPSPTPFRTTI